MEVALHAIFSLVKLAVLGSIYATLTLFIAKIIGRVRPNNWISKAAQQKIKFWFGSGATISAGLFLFAMTHWGNHAFGDTARLPLQYSKAIYEMNGSQSYIKDIDYKDGDLWIRAFAITKNFVVGRTNPDFVDTPKNYFAWNLRTNHVNYFETGVEYQEFARIRHLPSTQEFKGFWEYYSDFWHGWRFWTLL